MEKAQAVKQVLQIKKQYEDTARSNPGFQSTPEAQALSQQASALRQQYQIDDAKYGGGASLADAMTNYYKEFGGSGGQQQAPPQQQQQMGGDMSQVTDMYKQASTDFLDAQSANLQAQMQQQITELEQAYAQAISEGKISIRDAEQQFNAQKAQIEKSAYQQAEATKGYSSEMGIANSQQAIGLQQNDRARTNSLNNANASDRDVRIANIQDRISALSLQKNLGVTNAKNQYQIGMQGATAQASQMYNQSVGGMMEKDYFSDKEFAQENAMADKKFGQQVDLAKYGHQLNLEMLDAEQLKLLERMDVEAGYKVEQMMLDTDLKKNLMDYEKTIDIELMMREAGIKSSLISQESRARIAQTNAQVNAEKDAYTEARDREFRRLGINPGELHSRFGGNVELAIDTYQKSEQWQTAKKELDMKITANITEAVKTGVVMADFNKYYGEDAPQAPTAPTSKTNSYYSEHSGMTYDRPVNQGAIDDYNNKLNSYERFLSEKDSFDKKWVK